MLLFTNVTPRLDKATEQHRVTQTEVYYETTDLFT